MRHACDLHMEDLISDQIELKLLSKCWEINDGKYYNILSLYTFSNRDCVIISMGL